MSALKAKTLPSQVELRANFVYSVVTGKLYRTYFGPEGTETPCGGPTVAGYLQMGYRGSNWKAHRIIWMLVTGEDPGIDEIDHIDGVKHHNWWLNLRRVDRSKQVINSAISSRNTSGVKGVSYIKARNLWGVKISWNKIGYFLLEYKTLEEAAAVRLAAELLLHGEYRRVEIGSFAQQLGVTLPEPETLMARPQGNKRLTPPQRLVDLVAIDHGIVR